MMIILKVFHYNLCNNLANFKKRCKYVLYQLVEYISIAYVVYLVRGRKAPLRQKLPMMMATSFICDRSLLESTLLEDQTGRRL